MQIRDLFASENPQELELDDDPASYFPSFQVVSPTDEEVRVDVLSFDTAASGFCALVFLVAIIHTVLYLFFLLASPC
jgi:hypothetical protein